jgi:molybdopterin converting factor small subunit
MPHVKVPPPYQGPTQGKARIEVEGDTVGACLAAVSERYVGFGELIQDAGGVVHKFVTLFVNGEEIDRAALDTPVAEGDEVESPAASAGG